MAEQKRAWWQYNPDKVRRNVDQAKDLWANRNARPVDNGPNEMRQHRPVTSGIAATAVVPQLPTRDSAPAVAMPDSAGARLF